MYLRPIDKVSPPSHDSDDDDAAAPRPGFSLLEKYAYFGKRQNATTAACDFDNGKIRVTFCAAHPPRASYFCVHATGLGRTRFVAEPQILATQGPLALIYVVIDRRQSHLPVPEGEYFVYHAGGNDPSEERRPPSLKRLPNPTLNFFSPGNVTIVRHCPRRASTQHGRHVGIKEEEDHNCGDCNYVIAALRDDDSRSTSNYELCRYHSKTETWSDAVLLAPDRVHPPYPNGFNCKCITIGGEKGTVAWADLGRGTRGIIFCDVLAITDSSPRPVTLRCLDTPPKIKSLERSSCYFAKKKSCYVRDIGLVDGSLVYIELETRLLEPDAPINEYTWKANTWKIKINHSLPLSSSQWQLVCTFGSSEISKTLYDKLQACDADTGIYVGQPILSLQEDGIVYILARDGVQLVSDDGVRLSGCSKSWVLAIDMMKKMVKELDEFDTNRDVYFFRTYFTPSRITKHLQVDPGTAKHKRQKMMSDSEDNMDEDDKDLSPPPPPPPPPLTLEDLEYEMISRPWIVTLDELLLELEIDDKQWKQILQGQGSGA